MRSTQMFPRSHGSRKLVYVNRCNDPIRKIETHKSTIVVQGSRTPPPNAKPPNAIVISCSVLHELLSVRRCVR